MRRFALPVGLAVGLLLLVPAGQVSADWGWNSKVKETEDFERTVAFDDHGRLAIETLNGSIEIETWNRDEVEIRATKEARARDSETARELLAATEIVIDEGRDLEIRVERPGGEWRSGRKGSVSVNFVLMVPSNTNLEAQTTNGNVSIVELEGPARVKTTNGTVDVRGIGGDANIRTTNGSIRARDLRGHFEGSTTNGSIDAELTTASLDEDVHLETTNGSVELAISPALSASVIARAHNGRVSSDLAGHEVSKKRGFLEVELGGGGPRIEIRTTNGRVTLREGR